MEIVKMHVICIVADQYLGLYSGYMELRPRAVACGTQWYRSTIDCGDWSITYIYTMGFFRIYTTVAFSIVF